MVSHEQNAGNSRAVTWLLIGLVILLAVIPLFLVRDSEFGGADGAATEAIEEINPDVQPWFEPLWEPPGGETEALLFVVQAALGAALIGYFFGLKQGERRAARRQSEARAEAVKDEA